MTLIPHSSRRGASLVASLVLLCLFSTGVEGQQAGELQRLLRDGHVAEAATGAREALRSAPNDPLLHLIAGEALLRLDDPTDAVRHLDAVVRTDSTGWVGAWARVHRGAGRYALGDVSGAEADLRYAVTLGATDNATRAARSLLHLFALDETYSGWRTVESEHFRLHLAAGEAFDTDAFLAAKEAAFIRLQEIFFAPVPKKIDLVLWRTREQAAAAGFRALGFSRPEFALIHLRSDQSPGHELAHVLAFHAVSAPRVRSRMVSEGVATYFDLAGRNREAAAREAARQLVRPISIEELWEDAGQLPEDSFNPVAALVVGRLFERGGHKRFLELLQNQTLEGARAVYGDLLSTTIVEVEEALRLGN